MPASTIFNQMRMYLKIPALGLALATASLACHSSYNERCENERSDARICSAAVLQWGVVAAEARRQSQNAQQSDLLIDGLPVAAGVLLCQENISPACDAYLSD